MRLLFQDWHQLGRELLILSSEWPNIFGSCTHTSCSDLPLLLQPFSFQNIILFSLHSKLPSDVFPYNCRTGRIYLSVIKTPPYHCPHSWKLLSVLLVRQEVLCLHISTSVASIQPLSPVDYLWVGPSGSSVPLRLPQTNHRSPFHWMLLTSMGWVLNYLWLFLANSVWNNIEQGNQGYI